MTTVEVVAIGIGLLAVVLGIAAILLVRKRRAPEAATALVNGIDRLQQQLSDLSQLFQVPQTRGAVGETLLANLLATWLPKGNYELQHSFSNGTRVDAVVRLGSRVVPVDSKFPLEAATRFFATSPTAEQGLPADVRKAFTRHIEDISSRYIQPAEGTMGFALMYVPAEAVYYQIFVERPDEVMPVALKNNVVPVSPGSLFVYLQTVAYGLRGLTLSDGLSQLMDDLSQLRGDLAAFVKVFGVAGSHLRNLTRSFEEAGGRLGRLEARVERVGTRETETREAETGGTPQ